jgi:dUTP pyrophosphatase
VKVIRGFEIISPEAQNKKYNDIYLEEEKLRGHHCSVMGNQLPIKATEKAGAYDLINPCIYDITLKPSEIAVIWTGVKAYMPDDEILIIDIRSSVGIKKGLILANTIGIIDADYYDNPDNEGNIAVALKNPTDKEVIIVAGERIAQCFFIERKDADFGTYQDLAKSRQGGLGSTGK